MASITKTPRNIGTRPGWIGAINVKTQNRRFAYTSGTGEMITKNFGFAIPINSIINGIKVRVRGKSTSSQNLSIRLRNVTDAINVSNVIPVTIGNVFYGSAISVPGAAGITVADINSNQFGVILSRTSTGGRISVDVVDVTVYYTVISTDAAVVKNFQNSSNQDGGGIGTRLITDGTKIYGATNLGGTNNYGYLFSMNSDGANFRVLHNFVNSQGAFSPPSLTISGDGTMLYGSNDGTLYKISTIGTGYEEIYDAGERFSVTYLDAGDNTRLYLATSTKIIAVTTDGLTVDIVFDVDDVAWSLLGVNGNSFGFWEDVAVIESGATAIIWVPTYGYPTVSKLVQITVYFDTGSIYNVQASSSSLSGLGQIRAPVILSNDQLTVYGTSVSAIFRADAEDGANLTTLHSFNNSTEGSFSYGKMLLIDTTLFGVCLQGGENNGGTLWKIQTDGSGFEVMHHFAESTGITPTAGLCYLDNNLFGGTFDGGLFNGGTLFVINSGI